MANPKNVINVVKNANVNPANIVKSVSVAAVVGIAEAGKVVVDTVHEVNEKRREDAIKALKQLEELKQQGTITQEEFEKKRQKVIKKI